MNGVLLHTINNPSPIAGDGFGSNVAMDGDYMMISAPYKDIGGSNTGVVYLYEVSSATLLEIIINPSPMADSYFGNSVSLSDYHFLIGVSFDSNIETNAGRVYLYSYDSPTVQPSDIPTVQPSDGPTLIPSHPPTSYPSSGMIIFF